ncbi:MAG: hypothetical protein HY985_12090 [Magnetospirillum sp.]|nr:hypothetical protein [Magnetospirillum sp.]
MAAANGFTTKTPRKHQGHQDTTIGHGPLGDLGDAAEGGLGVLVVKQPVASWDIAISHPVASIDQVFPRLTQIGREDIQHIEYARREHEKHTLQS